MTRRVLVALTLGAVLGVAGTAPGAAAAEPALRVSTTHAPSHFLPGMVAASTLITVTNAGRAPVPGPVTVTDVLPAGLTLTAIGGEGWSCSGTTCSRSDRLPGRAAYPPIRVVVDVAVSVPEVVVNTARLSGGGSVTDRIPTRDACPYGWSDAAAVSFDGVGSGVVNPSRADGCTLLDVIWNAEPFGSHREFTRTVHEVTRDFVHSGLLGDRERFAIEAAAARSAVGTGKDPKLDNSCANRIALTFDDGISSYRPALLRVLREKQVHATFFDNGVRVEANPQIAAFQAREGHLELNHTYTHVHMGQLTVSANREEVLHNELVLAAAGAPIPFKGIRPPFGGSNPVVQRTLLEMGYTYFLNRINGEDWLPDKPATAIADDIVDQLRPGVIIGMHDGPVDTPAGAATVAAVAMIIDRARALGYCFGLVSPSGHVVADRYVPSAEPIPSIVNPVPYHLPLAFGEVANLPDPWIRIPSPLALTATHTPATFTRGQPATLTVTVTNRSNRPGDGSPVTVLSELPTGLTATAATGPGWTCSLAGGVTCSRTDPLAPQGSYPPITITVTVGSGASPTVTHTPTLSAHGEAWTAEASDPISVAG
jgi:peptidoglycan/xylan/chitin deacetylase (PgdA/CDA1 family)